MRGPVRQVVRSWIQAEETSGWSLMRKVPSTYTWRAIDYVAGLGGEERQLLYGAIEANALFLFEPPPPPEDHAAEWPVFKRFRSAMVQMAGDPQYLDVRTLRLVLGDVRGKRPSAALAHLPQEVLERAAAIEPTSAAQIRKRIKEVFAARLCATAERHGGGVWCYSGTARGVAFEVSVDYGGSGDQLRYSVDVADPDTGFRARRLVYEWIIGLGLGRWDAVTATNLEPSVDLLVTLVARLLEIPRLTGRAA